ncbi:MAG: hypothetical protein P4N59_29840, partial [Negativicutes bacterium]|nr:hypothetical protein [Negativicutes bacterium]
RPRPLAFPIFQLLNPLTLKFKTGWARFLLPLGGQVNIDMTIADGNYDLLIFAIDKSVQSRSDLGH